MSLSFGFIFLCVGVALASVDTYRAGFLRDSGDLDSNVPLIHEAGKLNVDILVLPSPKVSPYSSLEKSCEIDNYDEWVQTLSDASRRAGLYVVAHLLEKTRCQSRNELIRTNLVFDRTGNVVSVYRKPLNNIANCTTAASSIGSFTTDFDVQFGLLMEEDLVLRKLENLEELKNFVVTGAWSPEIDFLKASQFAPSWAFTNNVNLVSSSGIFSGRSGSKASSDAKLTVADLNKFGDEYQQIVPPVVNMKLRALPSEDMSQYIIRPLNVAASVEGYRESVCHGTFCCDFYVRTSFTGPKDEEVKYGLAAFSGIRHFDRRHSIGAQTCAVFACAASYKRTCTLGSQNNSTNLMFEKISISANFTESHQYPIILTTGSHTELEQFTIETKLSKQATVEAIGVDNLLTFGLFGRDFSRDAEDVVLNTDTVSIYEAINEEMTELFDYVWIRLRIVLVIASIYVLEMM